MRTFSVGQFLVEDREYSAEASCLGLKPGEVPREIGITYHNGAVAKFVFDRYQGDIDGNVTSFHYRDGAFDKVTIFND